MNVNRVVRDAAGPPRSAPAIPREFTEYLSEIDDPGSRNRGGASRFKCPSLFRRERFGGIDTRGAARGQPARERRDYGQHGRGDDVRPGIDRPHVEQE